MPVGESTQLRYFGKVHCHVVPWPNEGCGPRCPHSVQSTDTQVYGDDFNPTVMFLCFFVFFKRALKVFAFV